MAIVPLPPIRNLGDLQAQLYQEYKIEVPCIHWNERAFIRISVKGYNTPANVDALIHAVAELLPRHKV